STCKSAWSWCRPPGPVLSETVTAGTGRRGLALFCRSGGAPETRSRRGFAPSRGSRLELSTASTPYVFHSRPASYLGHGIAPARPAQTSRIFWKAMKISKVRPLVMGTPWRNLTFVVVETDDGLTGVGEARMINNTDALLGYLAEAAPRWVIGRDPFDREQIVDNMRRLDYSRAGEIAMSGIALIEVACWDIIGKALNQPVYKLMGGAVRPKVKAYANGWYTVERTPEEFAKAARKVVERGYKAAKLDPFGAGFYELEREERMKSVSLVEAVRHAVGPDFDIFVEMHGRF